MDFMFMFTLLQCLPFEMMALLGCVGMLAFS